MKKTLIVLSVCGLGYVAAAWTTGRIAQHQMDVEIAKVSALIPALKMVQDKHTRGVFGSTRITTVDMGAMFDTAQCAAESSGNADEAASRLPAMGAPPAEPLLLSLKQIITHGPLPGFGLPAAASVRYELLVNGQPVGDKLDLQIEGELPVLTVRYGFTGSSRIQWSGDAGKVTYVSKDSKAAITASWPSLHMVAKSKADLSQISYQGELPALNLVLDDPKQEPMTLSLKDLSIEADHHYPIAGNVFVSTGTDLLTVASVLVQRGGKTLFDAQGLQGKGSNTIDAGLLDASTQFAVTSVKAGAETAGPMHFDFTLAKLDAAAYGALMQGLMTSDLGGCPSPEKSAAFTAKLNTELPGLLKSGPEFRIDRISLGYQGQQAAITGKLSLPAATAEQLENPMLLLGLANGSLHIAVPEKLIQTFATKSIGGNVANEMALAENPDADPRPTPAQRTQAEAVAQTMMSQQLEQAAAKNWIVRGKEGVTSHIEYQGGQFVLNGQPIDLQNLRGGGSPADVE